LGGFTPESLGIVEGLLVGLHVAVGHVSPLPGSLKMSLPIVRQFNGDFKNFTRIYAKGAWAGRPAKPVGGSGMLNNGAGEKAGYSLGVIWTG
ncbi:MAG: hypothetical protein V3R66_08150, partial [Rhodospirillales bacterium]